jgi:hypothetical protein
VYGSASFGADFRALNFGDECDSVVAKEADLGAALISEDAEGPTYFFTTSLLERGVTVVYRCRENVLFSGSYMFDRTDYRDATALYARVKASVVRTLGDPTHDAASQKYRNRLRDLGLSQSEQDSYFAVWEKQNIRVHLGLSGPSGGEGWRVALSYDGEPGNDITTR